MQESNVSDEKVLATYSNHSAAEIAIKNLNDAGFDMSKITVIGMDYHTEERPIGFVNAGERMTFWGAAGAFWGSIWGMLIGSAMLFVPGVGHIVVGGWLASTFAGLLEGAVIGAGTGVLGGALASIGIPRDSVLAFEEDICAGKFVVAVQVTPSEAQLANDVLADTAPDRLFTEITSATFVPAL